jgi:hypothetical protein
MRPVLPLLPLVLTACVSTARDKDGTILTPAEANRAGLGSAVAAPLRDVNLLRTKIPLTLLEAFAEPYARPKDLGCAGLASEIRALNEALGPDFDTDESRARAKAISKEGAQRAALGMVAGTAQDLIPFRGWVRKLTGAEQHDKLVSQSITAGQVRRSYLKGLGEARGCNPPATPIHLPVTPEPPSQNTGPLYPTK